MAVKKVLWASGLLIAAVFSYPSCKKYFEDPYVTIVGPIEMADGLGRQAAELGAILMKDFKVNIIADHYNSVDVPLSVQKFVKSKKRKKKACSGKIVIFEDMIWAPDSKTADILSTVDHNKQIQIAYSMIEATRIPEEWVTRLNKHYDAVVVPDPFLIEVYKESGVNIPVFVIPLGVDLSPYLKQPLKKERNRVMLFSNLSAAIDRKNQVALIRAFAKVLGNAPDAALHINARGKEKGTDTAILEELRKQNCSNIYYTGLKLSKEEYINLFKTVDCYVSLSKGEGFSIQPREAMALGIPVIATNNTAQTTICNSGLVTPVSSITLEPARFFDGDIAVGSYFNCDEEEAAAAILDVYNNYDKHLEKGTAARDWSASYDYSSGQLAKLYKSLVSPKKIILGKENVLHENYMETDSKELYEKYLKIAKIRG